MGKYIVTKSDLCGDIFGFPIEVVQKMVDCQVEQGNEANPSVFVDDRGCGAADGGFDWSLTKMGEVWWGVVLDSRDFDLFFETYLRQIVISENDKILLAALTRIAEISDNETLNVFGSDINIESKISELMVDFPTNVRVTAQAEAEIGEGSGQISLNDVL